MSTFLLVLINGCVWGSIYAIMAMGLSTQYGVARILNIAHGEFIVLAAYITYRVQLALQQYFQSNPPDPNDVIARIISNPLTCLLIACPIIFAASFALYLAIYRRVKKMSPNLGAFEGNAILVAFGIYFIAQNLIQSNFGSAPAAYPFMTFSVNIGGVAIAAKGLFVMVAAIIICVLYNLFLSQTRLGKSIRAAAQEPQAAAMFGIRINTIMAICFAIGGVLAACAGVLYSMYDTFSSVHGMQFTTIAIIIIVFGGLGSVKGAIFGGFIMGIVGYAIATFVDPVFMISALYIIILVLLIVRPKGLLGR